MPTQIGRYRIVDELGHGGFGRVYRAFDPTVGRPVAIKILSDTRSDVASRFRNEAAVSGKLRHDKIVTIYEFGEFEERPYLVMEYLEGEDLQHVIASQKPLSLLQKCDIMSQVAEGLDYAHQHGVIHRDVKPANIMLLADNKVKIMDFGIARLTDRDATRLTREGFLIGTPRYMAPEQFAGSDVDALCDLFAYGVIYYELISGRHPFDAPDFRAMIYRLSFEDPAPIRDFIPDFPDALQRVISRMLHKDRELRYQSLREVLFDTDPLRIEMQQARAAALLVQAQELFDKKQLELAQATLVEARGLDPSNREARALWETVQKQLQHRTLQPRIESLVGSAEEHFRNRRFQEAIRDFDSALRLDSTNQYIQNRAGDARAGWKNAKEAGLLMARAREEFSRQSLTAAYRSVSEALHHDPQNLEAADLLRNIQETIERRQRNQQIEEAMHKAEGLVLLRNYDEAIELLTALGPDSQTEIVAGYLERIRNEKEQHQRQEKLHKEMAAATDLLREGRPKDALECLLNLKQEFPNEVDVANMLAYARMEVDAQARAEAIENAAGEARALAQSNQFDQALAILDDGLRKWPGESVLIKLLGSTIAAKSAWERKQAVESALRACAGLRAEGRLDEAIETLETALGEYSGESTLTALLEELTRERERQRRAEAVRKAVERAREQLQRKQTGAAVQFLRETIARYPGEQSLTETLADAERQLAAEQRARAIEAIQRKAALSAEAHDFAGALRTLEEGLQAFPGETALAQQKAAVGAAKAAWERQQDIQETIRRARQLEGERKFPAALEAIALALARYPEDPALLQAQAQVDRVWQQHKRAEAIRNAAANIQSAIAGGRLEEAQGLLRDATARYPGEKEWEGLTAELQRALEARARALAIEKAIAESRDLASHNEFDRARDVLQRALALYAGDAGLERELQSVTEAANRWRREQEIVQAVQQALGLLDARRFEEALQLVTAALRRFPEERRLVEARTRIEQQRDLHLRREAVGKAARDANALLDQGRIEEALELIRVTSARYAGEPDLDVVRVRGQQALAARQREEAIAKLAADARARAAKQDFAGALTMLAEGLTRYPEAQALEELQRKIQTDKAAWERRQAIQGLLEQARQLSGQGRLDDAMAVVRDALQRFPNEPDLEAVQRRIQEDLEKRKRAREIAQAAAEIQALAARDQWEEAARSAADACTRYPGEQSLTSLRTRIDEEIAARKKREDALRTAEELLRDDHFDQVGPLLEPLLTRFPKDAAILALLARARERAEAVRKAREREERLRLLLAAIGELGGAKRFGEALAKIDQALAEYPEQPELLTLRTQFRLQKGLADARARMDQGSLADALKILNGMSAEYATDASFRALQERARALSDTIAQCEQLQKEGRLNAALELAQKSLQTFRDEPLLIQLWERLRQAAVEEERRRTRERDLRVLRDMLEPTVVSGAHIAQDLDTARNMSARYSGDAEVKTAAEQAIQYLSDIDAARQALAGGNFERALEISRKYLSGTPEHPIFSGIRRDAEQGRKLAYLNELQRRLRAEPDLAKRAKMLESALEQYPGENSILSELRIARNKLTLAASMVERARASEAAGKWDEALEQWKLLLTIYEHYPGAEAEIQRVERAREAARGEAVTRWVREVEDWLKAGDLVKAEELLREAQTDVPGAPALRPLAERIEELRKKRKQARELAGAAQAAYKQGNAEQCVRMLREAYQLDETDAAFRRLVLTKLTEYAHAALDKDWRAADALVNEVLSLQPAYKVPEALARGIATRKKEWTVSQTITDAERMRNAGNSEGAMAELDRALAAYPDEARLKRLKTALAEDMRRKREAVRDELRRLHEAARAATQIEQLDPIQARATAIAAQTQGDAELHAAAEGVLAACAARLREIKRAQFRNRLAAYRKPVLIGLAGLAAAAGLALAVRALLPAKKIALTVASDVSGADVAVGSQHCVTPQCDLQLAPGNYTLTAARRGYKPISQPLSIAPGQAGLKVPLAFEPLPLALRVDTNFDRGQVYLDDQPAVNLRQGAFSASGLAAGKHTIRVTGDGADFAAEWQGANGEVPRVARLNPGKDLQATVISNVGGSGAVACNCGAAAITVDGASAGQTAADGTAALDSLKAGTRQIEIAGRPLVVNVQDNPGLDIFLSLERDAGTLVVVTGENGAAVYLNGARYQAATAEGQLRIPVKTGDYTVRVEKNGFRAPAAQAVTVKNGEQKQVKFQLTPIPAVLEIAGGTPGAHVKVDGRAAGDIGGNGGFRTEVAPGNHSIEITKDDFNPSRFNLQFTAGATVRPERAQVAISAIAKQPPPPDPKEAEAQDWEKVKSATTPEALDDFVRRHPTGAHADEARSQAARLRQQAQQQAQQNAARQAETTAWDNTDKKSKTALQDYLSRYPGGAHSAQANDLLTGIARQEAEAQAEQKTKDDRANRLQADQQSILQTLRDFEAAYNRKEEAGLEKVWVGISSARGIIRNQFQDARTLRYQLRPIDTPKVEGDSATVNCTRSLSITPKQGPRPPDINERVRVALGRRGSGWVIQSFTPY